MAAKTPAELKDGEMFVTKKRRNTLETLPTHLLAQVDGGKLSKQGRIDKLLSSKTPAEVRCARCRGLLLVTQRCCRRCVRRGWSVQGPCACRCRCVRAAC
jgi:hypothetical protein